MIRFVVRRVALMVPVALGIVFFCFLGLEMSKSSTAPQPGRSIVTSARLAWRDGTSYLRQAARGDLGLTWQGQGRTRRQVPVAEVLAGTYFKSFGLLFLALGVATVCGVSVGFFAAVHERSPLALGTMMGTLLGISTPTFFAALFLQILEINFYSRTGVRLVPVGGFGWDAHLVLPTLVLSARPLAHIARVTLVSMREVLDQDYMRTAMAKGLPDPMLWGGHALPNAAIPILTGIGISLRLSLGSLPVVEYFFGWPGLGAALLSGIRQQQSWLVVTLALALGLTFTTINLLLDLVYRLVDPRIGRQERAA